MRILFNVLPDPTDVVVAGYQPIIGDMLAPEPFPETWTPRNLLQGELPLSDMKGFAVPRALVGWNPYFARPEAIGPMATQGGRVVMESIGPAKPINPIIDPVQRFLNSALPLDATGAWYPTPNEQVIAGYAAPPFDRVLSAENTLAQPAPIAHPRADVAQSGLLKQFPVANMPANFGQVIYPLPQISYQVFTLNGVTVDGSGTPVGNARVMLYQSGWRYVQTGEKVIAETTSDGSGNFSFLARNIDYQLDGYKAGSPDVAGITRQDVVPTAVSTTLYLRDPTAADGPGGSAVYRVIGSPVVRRINL